jgi:histidinol-phosphatase
MSQFLDAAIEAAKNAEKIVLKHYRPNIAYETKGDSSPVTIADKEAEAEIRSTISRYFPDHSILGEEQGADTKKSTYTWVIDPIDGTKSYMRHIPLFGTLVSLFEDNTPIVGVCNMAALGEMTYAEVGGGAFCNGTKIAVSEINKLEDAFMMYGGLSRFEEKQLIPAVMALEDNTMGHKGFGDCWMYQLLAQGKVDLVIEARINIWDIAAGSVIISEAGGIMTTLEGGAIDLASRSAIAANKHLHAEVLEFFTSKK